MIICLPWVWYRARAESDSLEYRSSQYGSAVYDFEIPDSVYLSDLLHLGGVGRSYYRGPGLDYMGDPCWGFRSFFRVSVRQSGGLDI
jgi:hypothetical protein